jgi:hypothetical protein
MSEEQIDQIVQFYKTNTIFRLQKIIPIITERLEAELEKNGIPARVAARVKKPASLRGKLLKWAEPSSGKKERLSSPEATLLGLSDLAAVRVMTYTESDRSKVYDLATKIFKNPDNLKMNPITGVLQPDGVTITDCADLHVSGEFAVLGHEVMIQVDHFKVPKLWQSWLRTC